MSAPTLPKLKPRAALWLAGAVLCSGYYWLRTQPFPRRTPVGVERRLFGVGVIAPTLLERPGGGPVLASISWEVPAPPSSPPSRPQDWPDWLYNQARLRLDTGSRGFRPAVTPWPSEGTWLLEGDRVRYRWRLSGSWLGDHHLDRYGGLSGLGDPSPVLDLSTGRTYRGAAAEAIRAKLGGGEEEYSSLGLEERPDPVSPALDDLDPNAPDTSTVEVLEGREVALHSAGEADERSDLIAATTGEPYRTLVLSPRSSLLSVSHDARTLYVLKPDGLWRLDLRKPVLDLLREVTLPDLPLDEVLPKEGVRR